jgi:TRAP-type C4-dicarboxylate transport system substrate-binding protein
MLNTDVQTCHIGVMYGLNERLKEKIMINRRTILQGTCATGLSGLLPLTQHAGAVEPKLLKISHQFPGGTIDKGDFRDRLTRKFAQDVEKLTSGALKFEIYPNSSLMKTVAQFSAVRKAALDLTLYPLAYAGGEVQEVNIGLMPCMVTSYEQGLAWKKAEIGRELTKLLEAKGVKIITWIWQAGGTVSRAAPVVNPDDVKGLKIRGGSREMDLMLKEAGGIISSVPSNEIYPAMQTGSLDAAITSSTSLISFRLEEISKALTTGRGKSFWYMFEPLLMSKEIFDSLPKAQQKAIQDVGLELESFALKMAKEDDLEVATIYKKAGAKVSDMDDASINRWKQVAQRSAWLDFSNRSAECDRFLKMAQAVA